MTIWYRSGEEWQERLLTIRELQHEIHDEDVTSFVGFWFLLQALWMTRTSIIEFFATLVNLGILLIQLFVMFIVYFLQSQWLKWTRDRAYKKKTTFHRPNDFVKPEEETSTDPTK